MSKLKLFLILASALLISCTDSNPNNPDNGNDTGTGGGGTPLTENPSWFLTAEQQSKPLNFQEQILFDTTTSQKYRIPAIICADNGNLIAFADDRHTHGSDIGQTANAIDIVFKLSKDGGQTWADIRTILPFSTAGNSGIENKGDVIVFKSVNNPGTLVAMAASGGAWFGDGDPIARFAMSKSTDNGATWSQWKEVGQNIWDEISTSGVGGVTKAGFLASGRGLTLVGKGNNVKGRMVAGLYTRNARNAGVIYSVYSDDDGQTWHKGGYIGSSSDVPGRGQYNESKVIAELNDGTLVMSTRNETQGGSRQAAYSTDGGMSWYSQKNNGGKHETFGGWNDMRGSNTDSEGIVYTRQGEQDKNRMLHLHTTGTSGRYGMALYLSENEADTWTKKLTLESDSMTCCYNSIDVLPDGTVVALYERNAMGNAYDIVFKKFNLFDITSGVETYNADYYKDWYVGRYAQ